MDGRSKTSAINGRLGGRPVEGAKFAVEYWSDTKKKYIMVYFNKFAKAEKEFRIRPKSKLFVKTDAGYISL